MADRIAFDWDDDNRKHLAAHKVAPAEFEELLNNNPLDLDYELIDNEGRYRSVGLTHGGRLLSVVWTIRNGMVRAVSAFSGRSFGKKGFFPKTLTKNI